MLREWLCRKHLSLSRTDYQFALLPFSYKAFKYHTIGYKTKQTKHLKLKKVLTVAIMTKSCIKTIGIVCKSTKDEQKQKRQESDNREACHVTSTHISVPGHAHTWRHNVTGLVTSSQVNTVL